MSINDESNVMSTFYYRGELNDGCLNIDYEPSFFDALQLLHPQPSKSFHIVPLRRNTILRFNYIDDDTRKPIQYLFDFEVGIILVEELEQLGDPRYLSCFLIKEGRKVSYMAIPPKAKKGAKIRNSLQGN
ncbi:hypothetical protein [Bacillus sp. S/N-304-OC-R1]|uniref:hypothetical protein n=1 Tax=Bacillus sp. S/N-304-OC-R1 TaxID=2758034 RepID=UPI001C8EB7CD|nr:hypothetical protein [Bacillus sp. S/N-304-OC-R1]MBY0122280.1 hypothetical protein [Bacillus sp. S/N-304-OC-R1]